MPLNIALLGSGLFATRSHAPTLKAMADTFTPVAVWSRSAEKAATLAATLDAEGRPACRSYGGDDGLTELLACADVDAVAVCLPLDVQPEYIRRALEAGKHVLSEKPISSLSSDGRALIDSYNSKYMGLCLVAWVVGKI